MTGNQPPPENGQYVNPMNVRAVAGGEAREHAGDTHADASMMEKQFAKIGRSVTLCPWVYIILSVVISLGFAAGFFVPGLLVS
jgi:hypothetical protein